MLSSIKDFLFPTKIETQSILPTDPVHLSTAVEENRKVLLEIDNWIDDSAFSRSCFNYGVPDFIKAVINNELDNDPTYTDLMKTIVYKHFDKLNYLEIGVSVGKNFYQMMGLEKPAFLVGFDIEEINPVLESKLKEEKAEFWDTPKKSIKKTSSYLKHFQFENKQIAYLCADVWDENSWSKMRGNKYNLIFSDALHTPEAILFEFEMLVKYDLLDDRFVIVWDDLVGKMKNSFFKIIKKYDKKFGIDDVYFLNVNGWVGQFEKPHSVGIISNFKL